MDVQLSLRQTMSSLYFIQEWNEWVIRKLYIFLFVCFFFNLQTIMTVLTINRGPLTRILLNISNIKFHGDGHSDWGEVLFQNSFNVNFHDR